MAELGFQITYQGAQATLKTIGQRLRDPKPFLHENNLSILREALLTLRSKLRGRHRSGRLAQSLQVGDTENIHEVEELRASVGSALPYAGKVNFGGPIFPSTMTMLAIPLTDYLRNPNLSTNWPRDFDPGRNQLVAIPTTTEGEFVLFDPEQRDILAWLLVPSTEWGEGYHYMDWDEVNLRNAETLFYEHLNEGL